MIGYFLSISVSSGVILTDLIISKVSLVSSSSLKKLQLFHWRSSFCAKMTMSGANFFCVPSSALIEDWVSKVDLGKFKNHISSK